MESVETIRMIQSYFYNRTQTTIIFLHTKLGMKKGTLSDTIEYFYPCIRHSHNVYNTRYVENKKKHLNSLQRNLNLNLDLIFT